jgi:hypothetical protein
MTSSGNAPSPVPYWRYIMDGFHITSYLAWQAQERQRELLLEAQRMNEVTQARNAAPVPEAPKPALLARLTRLLPRFS